MMDEPKEKAVCPQCGEWNYKPPFYFREKYFNEYGIECYKLVSKITYKCKTCKHVWTEVWDEEMR